MGLDGTGEIQAFFSLVSFSVVGSFRAKHNRNRDTPFEENKNRLRRFSFHHSCGVFAHSLSLSLALSAAWEGRFTRLLLELRYRAVFLKSPFV